MVQRAQDRTEKSPGFLAKQCREMARSLHRPLCHPLIIGRHPVIQTDFSRLFIVDVLPIPEPLKLRQLMHMFIQPMRSRCLDLYLLEEGLWIVQVAVLHIHNPRAGYLRWRLGTARYRNSGGRSCAWAVRMS